MAKTPRPDRLSLRAQAAGLTRRYPAGEVSIRRNALHWRGTLRPSELSAEYTVGIVYRVAGRPRVDVVRPELQSPGGRALPHVYPNGSLCLFYPKRREWTRAMSIADTLVPWAAEWLFYYEGWLATGVWGGGGHEHGADGKSP